MLISRHARAYEAEDGARGARRHRVGQQEAQDAAGEAAAQVDGSEGPVSEDGLRLGGDGVQRVHVEAQVEQSSVYEIARDQPDQTHTLPAPYST